jgi:hypothetical protein
MRLACFFQWTGFANDHMRLRRIDAAAGSDELTRYGIMTTTQP